ncbi:hypothetical protein G3I32_04120 [Streptomyces coelicoflavus]|uniref:Transaldolase n=1 Tax=Streptomyces coelicoflavus TaxID=285562 RepID=A0A7K3PDW7_9ACTN|nr:hypothetical protein [Streptomyces coelicoflavus]
MSREAENLLRQLAAEGVSAWYEASRPEELDSAVLSSLLSAGFQSVRLPPGTARGLVQLACDLLLPAFVRSGGGLGQVSVPVDPRHAEEAGALLRGARALHRTMGRRNLTVRIPMTAAGVEVLADCLAEGIGVDATSVFSTDRYAEVLDAYMEGMERALVAGRWLSRIPAVTTVPVGVFDDDVDARLERLDVPQPREGAGQALARCLYRLREKRLTQDWWRVLRAGGALPPRLLWVGAGRRSVGDLVGWHTAHALTVPELEDAARREELRGDTLLNAGREGYGVLRLLEHLGARAGESVAALETAELDRLQSDWNLRTAPAAPACGGTARSPGP